MTKTDVSQEIPESSKLQRVMETAWSKIAYYLPSFLTFVAIVAIWDLAVRFGEIKSYILPAPKDVILVMFDPSYHWWENFLATAYACVGAFLASMVFGILLGVLVVWNSSLERTVMPILVVFNTLPKVALAPLFVIWLGYGIGPNIVIAVTVAFFPVVINTAVGLTNVEPELLQLARVLRATNFQIFAKIRFPNSLPYVFAGLKMSASMAVVGAIVGEFVASERGLGALIIAGGVTLDTASIFASLVIISLLGLLVYTIVAFSERIIAPWNVRE